MIKNLLTILIFTGLLCFHIPVLAAASEAQFLNSIKDLPMMNSMQELHDQTLVFDKAEGRIVEAVAVIENYDIKAPEKNAELFYSQTLPQLGWVKSKDHSYKRGQENLDLDFEEKDGNLYIYFVLTPQ